MPAMLRVDELPSNLDETISISNPADPSPPTDDTGRVVLGEPRKSIVPAPVRRLPDGRFPRKFPISYMTGFHRESWMTLRESQALIADGFVPYGTYRGYIVEHGNRRGPLRHPNLPVQTRTDPDARYLPLPRTLDPVDEIYAYLAVINEYREEAIDHFRPGEPAADTPIEWLRGHRSGPGREEDIRTQEYFSSQLVDLLVFDYPGYGGRNDYRDLSEDPAHGFPDIEEIHQLFKGHTEQDEWEFIRSLENGSRINIRPWFSRATNPASLNPTPLTHRVFPGDNGVTYEVLGPPYSGLQGFYIPVRVESPVDPYEPIVYADDVNHGFHLSTEISGGVGEEGGAQNREIHFTTIEITFLGYKGPSNPRPVNVGTEIREVYRPATTPFLPHTPSRRVITDLNRPGSDIEREVPTVQPGVVVDGATYVAEPYIGQSTFDMKATFIDDGSIDEIVQDNSTDPPGSFVSRSLQRRFITRYLNRNQVNLHSVIHHDGRQWNVVDIAELGRKQYTVIGTRSGRILSRG